MASGSSRNAVLVLVNVALTVTNAAKALVSAFTGKWDNAAFNLEDLDGHYKQAEYYLQSMEQHISEHGPRYPNYQELQATLQEYKKFLNEYEPILAMDIDQPKGRWLRNRTKSLEKTKNTAQWLLSVHEAGELKQRIIRCTDEINRHNKSISHGQLQVIIKSVEANISIRLQELEESIMTEIRASTARSQPTPSPENGWSRSSSRPVQSIGLATPPSEGPLQNRHRSRRFSTVSSIELGSPTEFQSYRAQITIKKSQPRTIEQEQVELSYGEITWENHHVRFIGCTNTATGFTVDHKCLNPNESFFPHTLHSSIGEPHEVYFLQDFSLEIRETGKQPRIVIDDPRYLFEKEEDCARFQSWLRCKQSMQTFEIETITANKKKEVAHDVGLKIWQDLFDGPSLSLFANKLTEEKRANMNVEFPIDLFKCDDSLGKATKSKKPSKEVKLEFEVRRKESTRSLRLFGRRKSDLEADRDMTRHPSMSSLASSTSIASKTSIYSNPVLNIDPEDLAKRLQHLQIEFSTQQECKTFTQAFTAAQESRRDSSSYFSSPEPRFFPSMPKSPSWSTQMEKIFEDTNAMEPGIMRGPESPGVSPSDGPGVMYDLPSPYLLPSEAQPVGEGAVFCRAGTEWEKEKEKGNEKEGERGSPRRGVMVRDLIGLNSPVGSKE